MHVIKKRLVRKFVSIRTQIQTPENSSTALTPCFSIMVKNLVTAAHWNTANLNLYHQPWTTDKQNRFFSLEAWGPADSNPQFTAKFLGRPLNIAFKSKFKATGKDEPCLCFLFAPDLANPSGISRLVQPCNFVIVNAFDGYDPIEDSVVKKFKSKKDLAVGTWYKKVWSEYCTAVVPEEYKQPASTGPVKVVEPKKKGSEKNSGTTKSLDSVFAKVNKNSTFSGEDDGDEGDDGDAENSEAETAESNVEVVARATVGGKSPRHLSSLEAAERYYRDRMVREGQTDKNLKKENKANAANKKAAKIQNPDFDSDNDSLPDVSEASAFTEESDFEDRVVAYAYKRYHEWHGTNPKKTGKKQQSEGSVSVSSGTYELC